MNLAEVPDDPAPTGRTRAGARRAVIRVLVLVMLVTTLSSAPALALRKIGVEAGGLVASSSKYGPALVYGASIMEGKGRFGVGFAFMRFGNSFDSAISRKGQSGEVLTAHFKNTVWDYYVSIFGTYMRVGAKKNTVLIAGLGPQIHFLSSRRLNPTGAYTETARDSRLGIGLMARYERVISMFGETTAFVSGSCSWMQSGIPLVDPLSEYTPPVDAVTSAALTVGLAFPF